MDEKLASSGKIALLGVILALASIPLLVMPPFGLVEVSVGILFIGILLLALPDIKRVKRPSIPFHPTQQQEFVEPTDSCAFCGRPVPKGVAYCPRCSSKLYEKS